MTTREQGLSQIDGIRDGLTSDHDRDDRALVSIIRDLWDGYPLSDAVAAARSLDLHDYAARRQITAILAAISE